MSVKNQLNEEIGDELTELKKMEPGSDTYKATVTGVTQLTDRLIKLAEIELAQEQAELDREKVELERERVRVERRHKKWSNVLTASTAILGACITVWSIKGSYEFEGFATHTTKAGNKAVDRGCDYYFKSKV